MFLMVQTQVNWQASLIIYTRIYELFASWDANLGVKAHTDSYFNKKFDEPLWTLTNIYIYISLSLFNKEIFKKQYLNRTVKVDS